jgi:hypothetical protein
VRRGVLDFRRTRYARDGARRTIGRRVGRVYGEYRVTGRDRAIQARNGVVFIQAWLNLQLEREPNHVIRMWLKLKKAHVEKQLEKLEWRMKKHDKPWSGISKKQARN